MIHHITIDGGQDHNETEAAQARRRRDRVRTTRPCCSKRRYTENPPSFSGKPVVVKIGDPPTHFEVNEHVLKRSSKYFQSALKEEVWVEGQERTITIDDIDSRFFNIYIAWLHSNRIFTTRTKAQDADSHSKQVALVECYILGDRLLDIDFKDAITDAMLQQSLQNIEDNPRGGNRYPTTACVCLLYENTTEHDRARQLYADIFAKARDPELLNDGDPPAFLCSVAVAILVKNLNLNKKGLACKYHEHGDGVDACYRTRLP